MEGVPLREIAETYGTPCFVYSEKAISSAYQAFDNAFSEHPHRICYSVKANSNLALLQTLVRLGAGFDIVSGGDLARVLKAGGDPSSIVFSGVGKQDWEIQFALEEKVGCFNVESSSELRRIAFLAKNKGDIAPISIRVNPDVNPNTHPYIATGLKENKFGVSTDEAFSLYQDAASLESLKIKGIDYHIGSQITEIKPFIDALEKVLSLVDKLHAQAITLQHIDLGGGLGVRYQDENPISISDFAMAVRKLMKGRSQSLIFEPGRLIVANAGVLLTKVNTLKETREKNFAIVDAAMNDLIRPSLYSAWQEITPVTVNNKINVTEKKWDIVGPICETGDFMGKDRVFALEEGQILAILSSGAYGFVMSSNYNSRPRAAEILISGGNHLCVRKRESIEDLFALESMKPAH